MSRRTISAAVVSCLVLLVVTLAAWARSYERVAVGVVRGKLYLLTTQYPGNVYWFMKEGSSDAPVSYRIEGMRSDAKAQWQAFGFDYVDSNVATAYGVSLLYFAAAALAGAAWSLYLLRRHGRRERLGLCLGCGYDLRESSGRCPECGREAPAGHGGRA